jgi:hypothetical protein
MAVRRGSHRLCGQFASSFVYCHQRVSALVRVDANDIMVHNLLDRFNGVALGWPGTRVYSGVQPGSYQVTPVNHRVPGGRHNKEKPRPRPGSEETSQPTGQAQALHKCEGSRCSLEDLDVLAQGSILPAQLGEFGPLFGGESWALTLVDLGLLDPGPHVGLGRSKSLATWPMLRSPRWHSSTISALNSGVNDRRGRGFFLSMVSWSHPATEWGSKRTSTNETVSARASRWH